MFTEASAFATIVGLLGAFTSGRQAESTVDVAEFIKWLIEHNHDELKGTLPFNSLWGLVILAFILRFKALNKVVKFTPAAKSAACAGQPTRCFGCPLPRR